MQKLTIPARLTLSWELAPGFGKKELRCWVIFLAPVLLIAILIGSSGDPRLLLWGVILFLASAAISYGALVKVDGSQSIYLFLVRRIRYGRSQQKFYYKRKEVISRDD